MAKKVLKKAQLGWFKKKPEPIDSGKYFNSAIKYYQDLADYRTAKGQTIEAAPAALAEKAKYEKKLADYNTRNAIKAEKQKKVEQMIKEKGVQTDVIYADKNKKKKGGAVKVKRKK